MPKYGHCDVNLVTWAVCLILIGRKNFCCALIGQDLKEPLLLLLCTECFLPADIMAVFVGLRAQQHGQTTWVSAVSLDDSLLDFDNVSIVNGGSQIRKTTLLNAQRQDPAIGKVLTFKESGRWPSPMERRRESPSTRVLLRQRSKLYLGKDGLL